MFEWMLVIVLALVLGWPLGHYLAAVMRGAPMRGDGLFRWVERPIYAMLGVDPRQGMGWRSYAGAFLLSNAVLALAVWGLFMTQAWLPWNPDGIANMSWDLALHTMVSFLTNTNQQHYAGQAQLSYLSSMAGIVGLQVITPMMGLALVAATLRGLCGGRSEGQANSGAEGDSAGREADVGNYWADVIRPTVRFMLPLCLVWSVLLTSQGVPSTLAGATQIIPVDAEASQAVSRMPVGPVAPMVAIKQLGTNGGGWYGPNGTVPLENPTPFSNLLDTLALILVPVAVAFMIGPFTGRRRFAVLVVGVMLALSLLSSGLAMWSEAWSSTAALPSVMEGKEVRFGVEASALYASLTTQTSNGSVNAMHDSMAPLTGLVLIGNMLVNSIWGGIGCGLQQFLVYLLLTVFLAGLMTGRTPELFGRRIEAREIRLLVALVLLQPVVLLGMTAAALMLPGLSGVEAPGFHGMTRVFYEYVSAFANNGSGFEGLPDASVWWNVSCSIVLAAGRYPALILPLALAAGMARKRRAPVGPGTLEIETATFACALMAVMAILVLLQFMPVLVLGPVAEHLSLAAS